MSEGDQGAAREAGVTAAVAGGRLAPGVKLNALELPIALEQAGGAAAGLAPLGGVGGAEVGVWEHTVGISTDTEVDELFVVISGRARIDFVEPQLPSLEIGPGDVMRLAEGMQTRWTVMETLRKVYVA